MPRAFRDRAAAGRRLAAALRHLAGRPDILVLGLPRGGVPVAYEVARALGAPLDVFPVRKLGVPGDRELAFGAIASGGVRVLNEELVVGLRLDGAVVDAVAAAEHEELTRRQRVYRGDQPPLDVAGKTVVLVDDGLATGASMRAAVMALRAQRPARIVVAVPTAAPEACEDFRDEVDEVIRHPRSSSRLASATTTSVTRPTRKFVPSSRGLPHDRSRRSVQLPPTLQGFPVKGEATRAGPAIGDAMTKSTNRRTDAQPTRRGTDVQSTRQGW